MPLRLVTSSPHVNHDYGVAGTGFRLKVPGMSPEAFGLIHPGQHDREHGPSVLEQDEVHASRSNPPEIAADIAREEAIMAATRQSDPDYKYHPRRKPLTPEEWARLLS